MSNIIAWCLRSQIFYDWLFVKIEGQLKPIKQIELIFDSTNILNHTETEPGTKKVYTGPSDEPIHYIFRKVLSSVNFLPRDIVCGNKLSLI